MHELLEEDIRTSGIKPEDMRSRQAEAPELTSVGVHSKSVLGYVIPYYNIQGEPLPHYRVKLLDHDPKYKQPKGTANFVYFPPSFMKVLKRQFKKQETTYVIITEGEKKALCGCKHEFPTCSIGGVNSWRNRNILLPEGTALDQEYGRNKRIRVRLPSGESEFPEVSSMAIGLQDLIDVVKDNNLTIIIAFDTDLPNGKVKPAVQKAAALLGQELRFHGVTATSIRQVVLPLKKGSLKVGLDDLLNAEGPSTLTDLIDSVMELPTAFPRHPNPKEYVNSQLQKGRLSRKEAQALSMCVLSELDANGRRLRSTSTQQPYYFDNTHHRLMPASLLQKHGEPLHESAFGNFLYRQFGVSAGDIKLVTWLATQFTGEEPIDNAEPRRIMAKPPDIEDCVSLQISDGQFILISGDSKHPIEVCNNGTKGLLFEHDQVEKVDAEELLKEFKVQNKSNVESWWLDVLEGVNIVGKEDKYKEHSRDLAALLFYVSPWLYRWRGTQLPIEIAVGEAGSGKSSIYSLRLNIMTGRPYLRNVPSDIRDWHSSVANSGGLHVIDNVQFTNNDLRQRISDEICRLTTEPDPHIEMRKLYTTSSLVRVPVRLTFAMTSIQQPFFNADLIQRAIIFDFAAIQNPHDGDWVQHQLEKFGGRTRWLAHHLVVLHRFLKAAVYDGAWDTEYNATHRLNHYEQCLTVMAEVLGMSNDWIAEALSLSTKATLSEADWALEGLKEFALSYRRMHKANPPVFTAATIAQWALGSEDYVDNPQLTNARRLGRYIQAHKAMIETTAGIQEQGTTANRRAFQLVKVKGP